MTLLSVHNLTVAIGEGAPVDNVSFTISKGETFALLGESGCGKSMTALALMRLLPQAAQVVDGSVNFAGQSLLALPETAMRKVRGAGMGMIFQEPGTSLNPVMSLGQQIAEVLDLHRGLHGEAARQESIRLFDSVGLPDAARRLGEYPFQLSGGMKQRAMIAMALAGEPSLLIADEPTTALDVTLQGQVLALLKQLQQQRGMGMLLITHDLGVVEHMADQVGVMYAGQLIEVAPREQLFARPAHPYTQKLFAALPERAGRGQRLETLPGTVPPLNARLVGCRFTPRCPAAMSHCGQIEPQWHALPDGQRVRCHLYDSAQAHVHTMHPLPRAQSEAPVASSAGAELLAIEDLKVHFPIRRGLLQRTVGSVRAVDGVSLSLPQGQTLALVGESGCGKTTVGKAILRLLPMTHGTIRMGGAVITTQALRAQAQMVFQDPFASLNPRMRIVDILSEGMKAMKIGGDRTARVAELLQQVGLSADMQYRYPHEFSGGQRQRIAIARALAVNPKLLICDEPTSALDVSVQAQIINLLRDLQQRLGVAYLFITHNIALVDYLADQVAVMYLGRIVETGGAEDVLRSPQHPYTQALLASALTATRSESTQPVVLMRGELPSAANPPTGCHFHPRCPYADARCRAEYPPMFEAGNGQQAACWRLTTSS